MLVYWDANALAVQQPTGIAVYASNLLRSLQNFGDLEFVGLLKLSRLKRRHFVAQHAELKTRIYIPPLSDWLLKRNAIYHGIDFKIPDTRRLPRVVTIHDLGVFESGFSDARFQKRGQEYIHYLIEKLQPDRIIVPTEFGRQHLLRLFPQVRDRVRVIPHGADHVFWAKGDAALPAGIRKKEFILCPGSVEQRKNGMRLIEAFENSHSAKKLKLIFAGGNGYNHEAIHRRAENSPAKSHIIFLPNLTATQLISLYQAALFTVYPSLFEGFGLPIVEALALQSPLLTSNGGAMAEVAGNAALTVDPHSTEDIRAALDRLTDDAALRADLSAKGKERVKQFTWQRAAESTRRVYQELIA